MKFGQFKQYNKRNVFLQKLCGKWGRKTRPRPLFKKMICSFASMALNLTYNKNKLYKTLDYWSRDTLNFNFSEKGLGLVSPSKCFSCYILLTDQISLSDSLFFSKYWTICVLRLFVNTILLIKPFYYITKTSRQKLKNLENEKKSLLGEIKGILHHL